MIIKIIPHRHNRLPIRITPSLGVIVKTRPLRILDFDVEARPLHWINDEYVSKEITAMAWAWVHDPQNVACRLLGEDDPLDMLQDFVDDYNLADLVTGHYIRGFDLPLINGALSEYGLPALTEKMAQDTKTDLMRRHGLSSSQENLGSMLGLNAPKVKMDQTSWRAANRLTPEGLQQVRERVTGDVLQHIELRQRLLDLNYLGPPVLWSPGAHQPNDIPYTP